MSNIRAGVLTALVGLVAAGGSPGADEVTGQGGAVGPVPDAVRDRLGLGDWYTQAAEAAGGIPVVASGHTNPLALAEAVWIIDHMLARRPDLAAALARADARVVVMAHDEFTTDVPEHARMEPADFWNRRARGLGGSPELPVTSCGEENLLCLPGDPYSRENILIHEFAHTVHQVGLAVVDPTFQQRLEAAFRQAEAEGRWDGTYARENPAEYWAEGVQSWLACNRTRDAVHGTINSAADVRAHDPPLAALLTEVLGADPWLYRRPAERPEAERAHLRGFDPASGPAFDWDRLGGGGDKPGSR
ncbi:MAG: hypothetical protein RLZZ440_1010 [Planctomycetota bacterium]|jgi:hypothetical protein